MIAPEPKIIEPEPAAGRIIEPITEAEAAANQAVEADYANVHRFIRGGNNEER